MRIKLFSIIAIVVVALCSFFQRGNYVPNEKTAIEIAEAVWLPIYGESIYNKKPFKAELLGDTAWHVHGTMEDSKIKVNRSGDTIIKVFVGGVPNAVISKSDGKIWEVYHTK